MYVGEYRRLYNERFERSLRGQKIRISEMDKNRGAVRVVVCTGENRGKIMYLGIVELEETSCTFVRNKGGWIF